MTKYKPRINHKVDYAADDNKFRGTFTVIDKHDVTVRPEKAAHTRLT